jgi:mannose-6-phosphate isomerase-like protein (cupin superfamily)
MKKCVILFFLFGLGLALTACSENKVTDNKVKKEAEAPASVTTKETFSLKNLVPEKKQVPDDVIAKLNAQHHQLKVLERRILPGPYTPPKMKYFSDYAVTIAQMPVINPGPGEYVHVMEGQRHGYKNLTIGITETFPGGAPPMHSHEGEESHVLLEGDILYALGDTMFTIKAPYIVNIPPGMPHAFKNIGNKTANLVVIFPTNIWKYDVLDYFPFDKNKDTAKIGARFTRFKNKQLTKK